MFRSLRASSIDLFSETKIVLMFHELDIKVAHYHVK